MIVKIGQQTTVDSADHLIIVEFDEGELELLRNLAPKHNVLYSYPLDSNDSTIEELVQRRINEEDKIVESNVIPLHEGTSK
jgi:hypothetical protein